MLQGRPHRDPQYGVPRTATRVAREAQGQLPAYRHTPADPASVRAMEDTIPRHFRRCACLPKREDRAPDVAGCVPAEANPAYRQVSGNYSSGDVSGASPVVRNPEPEERLAERRASSLGSRLD